MCSQRKEFTWIEQNSQTGYWMSPCQDLLNNVAWLPLHWFSVSNTSLKISWGPFFFCCVEFSFTYIQLGIKRLVWLTNLLELTSPLLRTCHTDTDRLNVKGSFLKSTSIKDFFYLWKKILMKKEALEWFFS